MSRRLRRLTLTAAGAAALALALAVSATSAPIARTTSLISAPTGAADPDTDNVFLSGASADAGRVFFSTTQKLTADDTDTDRDDVYERAAGVTRLVSAPTGVADPDTGSAGFTGVSADGSRVLFITNQKLTTDDGDTSQADVYQRAGGVTTLMSAPTGVADPDTDGADSAGASVDGSRVFFITSQKMTASDQDTNRRDIYERAGGTTTLMSPPTGVVDPDNADIVAGGLSADGSRVFFSTTQKLTADDNDTNREDLYERSGGVTTLVSGPTGVADPNSAGTNYKGASADGTRVFFETTQKLTADDGDTNRFDVYERAGGATTLLSGPTAVADPNSGGAGYKGASADGSRVFFETAQKLTADDGDTNRTDVYERAGGVTTLLSGPTGLADPDAANVFFAGASADGSRVFLSTTQRLTPNDNDSGRNDVYQRTGGVTTLVSAPTGIADPDTSGANFSDVSADGSRIFFDTNEKLTTDDGDAAGLDIYERADGVTTLISRATGVADPGGNIGGGTASADGSRVVFQAIQTLSADDGDSNRLDVFMAADTTAPETTITAGPPGTTGDSRPTFGFTSDEAGASFQCRVDAGPFVPCTSPTTATTLSDGPHSFEVRAIDNVGNVDATPAVGAFTIDTTQPLRDTAAPRARLSGKKTQKLGRSVSVAVTCLDEACQAVATGNLKLKRATKSIRKGRKATLKLKLSKKARSAIRRSLRKRRKVRAKLKVTVTDAAGNRRVLRRTVRLRL